MTRANTIIWAALMLLTGRSSSGMCSESSHMHWKARHAAGRVACTPQLAGSACGQRP